MSAVFFYCYRKEVVVIAQELYDLMNHKRHKRETKAIGWRTVYSNCLIYTKDS